MMNVNQEPERIIQTHEDAVQAIRDAKWRKRMRWEDVEAASGVRAHTIINWSGKQGPNLTKLMPVLDAVGLEMVIRPKEDGEL